MTTSVRYKSVTNATGAALTAAGVPSGDGVDKLSRTIKRTFAAADIGIEAGKTQHASGCIIDVLPTGTNVLSIKGAAFKVTAGAARGMDNLTLSAGTQIASLSYSVDTSLNVRVVDAGNNATVQLAATDYVVIELVIGPS
jgi:hypothetical protein